MDVGAAALLGDSLALQRDLAERIAVPTPAVTPSMSMNSTQRSCETPLSAKMMSIVDPAAMAPAAVSANLTSFSSQGPADAPGGLIEFGLLAVPEDDVLLDMF
ncbi:hypothetical protein [Nannocystis pusilla]|uniref:hypothetical protein n=1 Tax=Nannocystis pusilla TaxID=889268 RepID=UPI003DA2A1FE